ncbi:MAG: hypothetical protein ACSLE0_13715 [Chitinophagaceae bacterium]
MTCVNIILNFYHTGVDNPSTNSGRISFSPSGLNYRSVVGERKHQPRRRRNTNIVKDYSFFETDPMLQTLDNNSIIFIFPTCPMSRTLRRTGESPATRYILFVESVGRVIAFEKGKERFALGVLKKDLYEKVASKKNEELFKLVQELRGAQLTDRT